jgi:hypothetical protein
MQSGRSRDIVGTFLKSVEGARPDYGSSSAPVEERVVTAPAPEAARETSEIEAAAEANGGQDVSANASGMPVVLRYLASSGELDMPDLASGVGVPLVEVADLLGKLQSSGLISIAGAPGHEQVSLTDAGRTVAALS